MSSKDKAVFWASKAKLNEPEGILKEHGWQRGSRPAASDFNWLFNSIQKDLHTTKLELKELKEKLERSVDSLNQQTGKLANSLAIITKTANHSLSDAHRNRELTNICLRSLGELHLNLNDLVNELKHYNPRLKSREWGFKDEFDLVDDK